MPLKLIVDSLDSIPEEVRSQYKEENGKFRLDLEGYEDPTNLKSALEKERKANREADKLKKSWEALGKTPDEIQQLLATHEEAERKKLESAGDHAKILQQHQEKWTKEKQGMEAELNAARTSERAAIIENRVMTALTRAGVTEEGADLLPERLAGRIRFETEDGKRVVKIMQPDGVTPMAGSGDHGVATFDDLVKEAQTKWPSLFKAPGNSGGGGGNPDKGNGKHQQQKKAGDMNPTEKAEYIGQHGIEKWQEKVSADYASKPS